MKLLSLCSGYGGLDLGLSYVVETELVAYAEFEKVPSSIMEYWHPGVPNYGDITQIDWSELADLGIEIITAGYPCQPFSLAGRRKGTEDTRHIWPYIAEAVRVLRPRLVFLENVPGHRSKGFGDVLGDLAEAGYDVGWTSLRASDVGAPHQRERVFLLASDSRRVDGHAWRWDGSGDPEGSGTLGDPYRRGDVSAPADPDRREVRHPEVTFAGGISAAVLGGDGQDAPDPEGFRREARRVSLGASAEGPVPPGRGADPAPDRGPAADSDGERREGRPERDSEQDAWEDGTHRVDADGHRVEWGDYGPAIVRWARTLRAPVPYPVAIGPRGGRRVSVDFVEWMMGVPGRISSVPGMRLSQGVKAGGNGVVPLQAGVAFAQLVKVLYAGIT